MPCERKHIEAIQKLLWDADLKSLGRHTILDIEIALGKALSACDESPWRSMESAPKTEFVLAVVGRDVRLVRYGKTGHVPLYGWCIADMGPDDCDLCKPTHWMPLPAAPEGVKL